MVTGTCLGQSSIVAADKGCLLEYGFCICGALATIGDDDSYGGIGVVAWHQTALPCQCGMVKAFTALFAHVDCAAPYSDCFNAAIWLSLSLLSAIARRPPPIRQ